MTIAAELSSTTVFHRAGLPQEEVAAWLACDGTVAGDFRCDAESLSRQWRIGAALHARLPGKSARSQAQAAAAVAIMARDRAARENFLSAHVEALYRRLTDDYAKFVRVEHLVRDAAVLVSGLAPDESELSRENGLQQRDKEGAEIDQGLLLSHVLAHPVAGMHLCHAMLLPRPEALEQSRRFAEHGKLALDGATLERHGQAALVTMRNPRFLNAEDETTLDGLEVAIDIATLDPQSD